MERQKNFRAPRHHSDAKNFVGRIEVLLIYEQMVVGGYQVALHEVTMYTGAGCLSYQAITLRVVIVLAIDWLGEVVCQHTVRLRIGISGRSVSLSSSDLLFGAT